MRRRREGSLDPKHHENRNIADRRKPFHADNRKDREHERHEGDEGSKRPDHGQRKERLGRARRRHDERFIDHDERKPEGQRCGCVSIVDGRLLAG